jgi:hypothetical protein
MVLGSASYGAVQDGDAPTSNSNEKTMQDWLSEEHSFSVYMFKTEL